MMLTLRKCLMYRRTMRNCNLILHIVHSEHNLSFPLQDRCTRGLTRQAHDQNVINNGFGRTTKEWLYETLKSCKLLAMLIESWFHFAGERIKMWQGCQMCLHWTSTSFDQQSIEALHHTRCIMESMKILSNLVIPQLVIIPHMAWTNPGLCMILTSVSLPEKIEIFSLQPIKTGKLIINIFSGKN